MSVEANSKENSEKPKNENETLVNQTKEEPPKLVEDVKTVENNDPKDEMAVETNPLEIPKKPQKTKKKLVKRAKKKKPTLVEDVKTVGTSNPKLTLKKFPSVYEEGDTDESNEEENETFQKFVLELQWCIDQLSKVVEKQKAKREAVEASKKIKILANPKAQLVKKRYIMRTTFGDYRQKMKQDELKYNKDMKKLSVSTVKTSHQKGTFLKKCDSSKKHELVENSANVIEEAKPGFSFKKSDNSFKFNFLETELTS